MGMSHRGVIRRSAVCMVGCAKKPGKNEICSISGATHCRLPMSRALMKDRSGAEVRDEPRSCVKVRLSHASLDRMSEIAREIVPVNLEDEMRQSYLDYAMSVIVGRALPD